jgi:uncharacterized protein
VRAKSGGEIVVVTLESLNGRPITEWGLEIGRQWRIGPAGEAGDRGRNTGLVFLVAPNDRELRIELGEADQHVHHGHRGGTDPGPLRTARVPGRRYGEGIYNGVAALALEYADEFGFELTGDFTPPAVAGTAEGAATAMGGCST